MAASKTAQPKFKPILLLILLTPVAIFMLPSTIVLLAAMVPTAVARVVDATPQRYLTLTVGAMNLAGALWMLHDVWVLGGDFNAILPTLRDTLGWLAALLGAGSGWVIYGAMGAVAAYFAQVQTGVRLRRLQRDQESLIAEWGEPVRYDPRGKE